MKTLKDFFNNNKNIYYGHGTGNATSQSAINNIFEHGLRCSNKTLDDTSCSLCLGNPSDEEFKDVKHHLNNWPHKSSTKIIIVSLPYELEIIEGGVLYKQRDSAFYYVPDEEKRTKYELSETNYIRPEFVMGCYDSESQEMIINPKYYEIQPQEKQNEIINEVKQNYMQIIEDIFGLSDYIEVLESLNRKSPVTEDEVNNFFASSLNNKNPKK